MSAARIFRLRKQLSSGNANEAMETSRPVFLPVILGTARHGRRSEPVVRFIYSEVAKAN
jgi:hypothetical protein